MMICPIARILSLAILAYQSIFIDISFPADFTWVMNILNIMITSVWFINTLWIKIIMALLQNAGYCIVASTVNKSFQHMLPHRIMIPIILMSIIIIAYDMSFNQTLY